MKNFQKWLVLREAAAKDESLLAYLKHIESNPNVEDINTLISMMKQTRDQRRSEVIPQILARLKITTQKLPPDQKQDILQNITDAEEEIFSRSKIPGGEIAYKQTGFDTGSGWEEEPSMADKALELLFGNRNSDYHFTEEVIEYMKDHYGFDLNSLEEDPIIDQAYSMIKKQHATGILDTRSIAEKVVELLRNNGKI